MLVLTRRLRDGEDTIEVSMKDGTKMTIVLLHVDHNRVRLGFDAPQDVRIARQELANRRNGVQQ